MSAITAGDIITTNYCGRWPETFRVIEVVRDCECGRYGRLPFGPDPGRQRLPHLHITALNSRSERCGWNGMLERNGRIISSGRHRTADGQRFHPEVIIVAHAEQGSLF